MKKKKRLSGIERRWFVNNVGVIMLLVAACVLGVVFSMAAYYDTNLRSGLENKAKTTTDFFSNYISQSYKEYYQSCIKFAQTFEEKDRLELIHKYGLDAELVVFLIALRNVVAEL